MRLNIFDGNNKLIGQDYQKDDGEWMHKWYDTKNNSFERGSWTGRSNGENKKKWRYEESENS